jgi:manganese/zinc/iron transport system permease protein
MIADDVQIMAIFGSAALLLLALLFKELKLLTFDSEFAAAIGYPVTPLTILLTSLIVVAVVIGLQAVGVILMVTVLVAPALAARQWTNNLAHMMMLASVIGGLSGVVGAVMSAEIEQLPTGPTIVLISTAVVLVSLLLAPERGLLWAFFTDWRTRGAFQQAAVLAELRRRGPASEPELASGLGMRGHETRRGLKRTLGVLARSGLVRQVGDGWTLTEKGREAADDALRREQLWRAMLARQMALPADAIHLTMDQIERALGPEAVQQLLSAGAKLPASADKLAAPAEGGR